MDVTCTIAYVILHVSEIFLGFFFFFFLPIGTSTFGSSSSNRVDESRKFFFCLIARLHKKCNIVDDAFAIREQKEVMRLIYALNWEKQERERERKRNLEKESESLNET